MATYINMLATLAALSLFLGEHECCGGAVTVTVTITIKFDFVDAHGTVASGQVIPATPKEIINLQLNGGEPLHDESASNTMAQNKCKQCIKADEAFGKYDNNYKTVMMQKKASLVFLATYEQDKFQDDGDTAQLSFTVDDVYATPNDNIRAGETFKITLNKSKCPCFKALTEGRYVITGSMDKGRKLKINGGLIQA